MCKLLIIEDDEQQCDFLESELKKFEKELKLDIEYVLNAEKAISTVDTAVKDNKPFDVLLIDLHLDHIDGIDLMKQLRGASPETAAIIMTYHSEPESGQRAYEAGAERYLTKPINSKELFLLLKSLHDKRDTEIQRDWLQKFIQIHQDAERSTQFADVAEIILNGCLSLGFQRAFLLWIPYWIEPGSIIGICHLGKPRVKSFDDHVFSIQDSPYLKKSLSETSKKTLFFDGRELGDDVFEKVLSTKDYQAPPGEWVLLPIWVEEKFAGAVILDFAQKKKYLKSIQRSLLYLLTHQITSMLERARLAGLERRNTKIIRITNEIGRFVNDRAAYLALDELLNEIRNKVQELMDVNNFIILLLDENTRQLDFRLHYDHDQPIPRHYSPKDRGLAGRLISSNEMLYLTEDDDLLKDEETIKFYGAPLKCWGGAPLRIEGKAVGAIMMHNYENSRQFSRDDLALLQNVADQIAGAILMARKMEHELEDKKRLFILETASAELVKLAHESEESLWFVLLTLVTAEFGLCFNRAWLFLCDANCSILWGVMGIGNLTKTDAERDWDHDSEIKKDFNHFLADFHEDNIQHSPIEANIKQTTIVLDEKDVPLQKFLLGSDENKKILSAEETGIWLPDVFIEQFEPENCAILALKSKTTPFGLLVVDNKHNGCVVHDELLEQLEALMNIGITAYEYARREEQIKNLLGLTNSIVHQPSGTQLRDILISICKTAHQITGADYVIIFPLKSGDTYEYDTTHIANDGKLVKPHKYSDKPRKRGMSSFILNSEHLVIKDVENSVLKIDGVKISEHKFIIREGIKAFIGIPIRDINSSTSLGVMYLDYRTRQDMNDELVQQALAISTLAGFAIQVAQRERRGQSNERELIILKRIFEQSLGPVITDSNLFRSLAGCLSDLVRDASLEVTLYRQQWQWDEEQMKPRQVFQCYSKRNFAAVEDPKLLLEGEEHRRVLSAMSNENSEWDGTDREVFVPLMTGKQHLGVIRVSGFTARPHDWELHGMKRLTDASAPAFENLTRQRQMRNILKVVSAIIGPEDLESTFKEILNAICEIVPMASSAVLWYTNPLDKNKQILGTCYGVGDEDAMRESIKRKDSKVLTIMNHPDTSIWEPDMNENSLLWGQFVQRENVKAAVAFRLTVEKENVGALFINYTEAHDFTDEEKYILHLMAEICAVNIHDAIRLSVIQNERDMLNHTLAAAKAVGTTFDLEEISCQVLGSVKEWRPEYEICLLLYDEDNNCLNFASPSREYYRVSNPVYEKTRILKLDGNSISALAARQAIREKDKIIVNTPDVKSHPSYMDMVLDSQSQLTIAMAGTLGQLLCVLVVERKEPEHFDSIEVDFFSGAARHLGMAIERVRQAEHFQFKDLVASLTATATELAHGVKGEVGRIRHYADWIIRESENKEKVCQYAQIIDECAARLAEAGPWTVPQNKKIIIDEALQDVLTDLSQLYQGIECDYKLKCQETAIMGNNTILRRVFRHLLSNSARIMDSNGQIILHSFIPEDNRSVIEILFEDTGPGVDEKMRPYILKQPIPKDNANGGYGLLFTRQLVESLGGSIHLLATEEGRGAVFSIHLPIFFEE